MSSRDLDREIARLFEEQRRADQTSAPAFRQLLARRPARGARGGRWIRWPALAAVTAAVVVAAVLLLRQRPPSSDQGPELFASATMLAAWKAPTDSLLETPGADLLGLLPVLVSPVPKAAPTQPPNPKGVPR